MNTNFFKADRRIQSRSDRRIIRVNSCPFVVLLIFSLFATPVMAQQDGAPELTVEATRAIDKGLNYLLSV
ncbi:MAG: hypothetical protein ACI9UA_006002, partial [Pseudoalteromonas tetraodonis]